MFGVQLQHIGQRRVDGGPGAIRIKATEARAATGSRGRPMPRLISSRDQSIEKDTERLQKHLRHDALVGQPRDSNHHRRPGLRMRSKSIFYKTRRGSDVHRRDITTESVAPKGETCAFCRKLTANSKLVCLHHSPCSAPAATRM